MNEISFGKSRKILLPILLGLMIIFFLKLCSIKISFWILIVLLIATLLVIKPILVPKTSSPTSKLPPLKTTFWILFFVAVAVAIIFVIISLWPSSTQEVCVKDGYLVEDQFGVRWICGDVEFKKVDITTKSPNYIFSILGLGKETASITVAFEEAGLQKCEFSFTAKNSEEIQFGASARGVVYAYVNGINLREAKKIPEMNFFTDGQKYNVTVRIEAPYTCECWKSTRFYQRGSKIVDRNDLLNRNMIGLIKFDF
ncbi:MAG: DUF5067 domain-containing protein [Desulfobacula sp.]|nr:DUF5067 domain-containing protein [Desulfobacula sp.]